MAAPLIRRRPTRIRVEPGPELSTPASRGRRLGDKQVKTTRPRRITAPECRPTAASTVQPKTALGKLKGLEFLVVGQFELFSGRACPARAA